jgi:hypothetical protein
MRSDEIDRLEAHLLHEQPHCTECQAIRRLVSHTASLQKFVLALADHHKSPGPSPEKTAEHYQLMSRIEALISEFERPLPSLAVPARA